MTSQIKAGLLAVLAAALIASGWVVNGWRQERNALRGAAAAQDEKVRDLGQQLQTLQAANARGEALSVAVAQSEQARQTITEEKRGAIQNNTVGRRCLDERVVRVLNNPAGAGAAHGLSEATGDPVSEAGAFATDTDVGQWSNLCRSRFETCNDRLGAIGEFFSKSDEVTGHE